MSTAAFIDLWWEIIISHISVTVLSSFMVPYISVISFSVFGVYSQLIRMQEMLVKAAAFIGLLCITW